MEPAQSLLELHPQTCCEAMQLGFKGVWVQSVHIAPPVGQVVSLAWAQFVPLQQ
jgi:hypothetical protein